MKQNVGWPHLESSFDTIEQFVQCLDLDELILKSHHGQTYTDTYYNDWTPLRQKGQWTVWHKISEVINNKKTNLKTWNTTKKGN